MTAATEINKKQGAPVAWPKWGLMLESYEKLKAATSTGLELETAKAAG